VSFDGVVRDPLFDTTDYRRFLQEALRRRGLQQQDLAKALDRAPSTISLALSGLRPLDPKLVDAIASFLELDAEQTAYFAALVDIDSKSPRAQRNAWATVQATQRHRAEAGLAPGVAEAARRWYFPVVVELADCDGFRPDPAWIAGTVSPPITVAEAEGALTTAIALGVLAPNEEGRLTASTEVRWTEPDVVGEEASQVTEFHRAGFALAAGCLDRSHPNERHVSTAVFRITEEQFERIRARLRELEREIVLMAAGPTEPADRVYQLGVQLFPVTLFSDSTADHSMFARSQGDPLDIDPDTTE
jgi:uncharacterized protein (TIGR02147 family)